MEKLDLINALDEIDLVLTITISAFDAEINEQHLRLLKDSIISISTQAFGYTSATRVTESV